MSILVVVADASRARFFTAANKTAALIEMRDLVNTASRLSDQDLVTDGQGSVVDSTGHGHHTMGHEDDAHKHQLSQFARQLADDIDKERGKASLRRVYTVS